MHFIWKRLLATIPSLFGVVILTFLLSHALPGDPAAYFAGPAANADSIAEVRQKLGLDRPLIVQFLHYVGDLARGELGNSLTTGQPVLKDLVDRLPASLELSAFALLFAIGVAIPMGVLAAIRLNGPADHACRAIVTVCAAFPTFFIGLLLVYVFYFLLGMAPEPLGRLNEILYTAPPRVTGAFTVDALIAGDMEVFRASLAQLVLPAISLGLFALAPIARITRAAMLESLSSDFVRTARSSGLPTSKVLFTYAFRNSLLPISSVMGMVFSFLLGSNVLIEQVFGWQGVGAYAVSAVLASDYAAVQGFVLMMAILYILLNLVVDVLATLIDPRVRFEG
ncbi:peptide ABC transporter permease [Skermanella stibiiresistens SB22]|uniref:Peptide ABC transporter permease n=1 Tax=Skermanella stibiiresistens SB22 TaxID=1385369 RepID=W9H604_9PROT|nr:ABC transporter permease [Skermanella stibiiresistens]EWY41650.1 peptide ABC transporter permease [Skermanella stibiiresistens SB22]